MSPRLNFGKSQAEIALLVRYAVDTAIAYPSAENIRAAVALAGEHPFAMASSHVRHNLGSRRLDWLRANGALMTGVVAPDITK